jgi:hypothetical protein
LDLKARPLEEVGVYPCHLPYLRLEEETGAVPTTVATMVAVVVAGERYLVWVLAAKAYRNSAVGWKASERAWELGMELSPVTG